MTATRRNKRNDGGGNVGRSILELENHEDHPQVRGGGRVMERNGRKVLKERSKVSL